MEGWEDGRVGGRGVGGRGVGGRAGRRTGGWEDGRVGGRRVSGRRELLEQYLPNLASYEDHLGSSLKY